MWQGGWSRGQGRGHCLPKAQTLGLQSQTEQLPLTGWVTMGKSLNLSLPLLSPLQGPWGSSGPCPHMPGTAASTLPLVTVSLQTWRGGEAQPDTSGPPSCHCNVNWTFALSAGMWAGGGTEPQHRHIQVPPTQPCAFPNTLSGRMEWYLHTRQAGQHHHPLQSPGGPRNAGGHDSSGPASIEHSETQRSAMSSASPGWTLVGTPLLPAAPSLCRAGEPHAVYLTCPLSH